MYFICTWTWTWTSSWSWSSSWTYFQLDLDILMVVVILMDLLPIGIEWFLEWMWEQIEFTPAVCTHVCRAHLKRKWCSMCECVCDLALAKWLIQVGCWSYQLTTLNSAWWMDIQLFECLTHNSQHFTLDIWSLSSHFTTSHARVSFLILINYSYTILLLSLNLIILLLFWSSC